MPAYLHRYHEEKHFSYGRLIAATIMVGIGAFLLFPDRAGAQAVRNGTTVYGAEGNLYGTAGRGTGTSNIYGTGATNNGSGHSSLYGFGPGSTSSVSSQAMYGGGTSPSASGSEGGPTGSISDAPNSHGGDGFYGSDHGVGSSGASSTSASGGIGASASSGGGAGASAAGGQ